jgi:hypothetical protein
MKRTLLLICLALFAASTARAAKYAGEFLEIGVGARAVGMGGAMTAHADDAMSFYWNPAGMGYVSGVQAAAMYADLWNGLANYSVAGLTLPVSGAVFSVNYVRLGVPNIGRYPDFTQPGTRVVNGDTLSIQEYLLATQGANHGTFSDNESAVFLTFAKLNKFTIDFGWAYFQVPVEFPIGANVKIINENLGGSKGSGIGVDLGGQIRLPMQDIFWDKWKAHIAWGINVQDLTRTAVDWGENNKDAIPTNYRNGVAFIQKMPGRDSQLILSYDAEKRWAYTNHFGLEYQFEKVLALRGGFWGSEWTAGAGISIWRATVDYAYLSRELGSTHRVSVAFKLR